MTGKMSRREATEYWDAHGIDEVEQEGDVVEIKVRKPLAATLTLRLDADHLAKLRFLAKTERIGPTTLARRLLNKALHEQEEARSAVNTARQPVEHGRVDDVIANAVANATTLIQETSRALAKALEEQAAERQGT